MPSADGRLSVSKVVYTPPGAANPVLKAISFEIAAGEAVGLVGASGAGKSSLAKLITCAAPATEGRIELGGVEAGRWTRQALARQVGYLPQEVGLFPGTIADNIARFQDGREREIAAAARRAGAHDLILALPDGYETELGEGGAGLSGGQRQRIGLARAVFGSPRLLVLDEPNAHLDENGERALALALRQLQSQGSTIVIITHRPSVLQMVDRLIVLSEGRVAADGPRAALLEELAGHPAPSARAVGGME